MPIRLVDGERLARSDKLKVLALEGRTDAVAWYPWFVTCALSNGSFEYKVRAIWRDLFAELVIDKTNRPILTEEEVSSILAAYQRVKLLFTWRTEDGKLWAYLTKIEAMLPPVSWVRRGYRLGAPVPVGKLAEFLGKSLEEVSRELNGTAASLDPCGAPVRYKGDPRQEGVRYRRGVGREGGAGGVVHRGALSAQPTSSPTAPPSAAQKEVPEKKKQNSPVGKAAGQGPEAKAAGQGSSIPGRDLSKSGNYALFEEKYREFTGRLPGGSVEKQGLYRELCETLGEEAVLEAVGKWAAQRGGPGKLSGNRFAMWDFLRRECRAEIVGGRSERARGNAGPDRIGASGSFAERLEKHTAVDESTRALLEKAEGKS